MNAQNTTTRSPYHDLPDPATERITLGKLRKDDAADLFEYASEPEAARYTKWDPHSRIEDSLDFIARVPRDGYENPHSSNLDMGDRTKENGRLIGTLALIGNLPNRAGEVGYAITKPYWGAGHASEAASAAIKFGFERLGLNRLEAFHIQENAASGRVLEKAGMRFVGTPREKLFLKGRFLDLRLYSI